MNALPLDRASLVAALASGREFTYRCFYGHTPRPDGALSDAVFSQWWASPFEVEGVRYGTAEHWMMAGKARVFRDEEALRAILAAPSPSAAKELGRKVRNFEDAIWKKECFAIVTEGNVHKFASNPDLRRYLMATEGAILVEASPTDRVWGIGLSAKHADAEHPARWRGANLLGFALVAARERLRG